MSWNPQYRRGGGKCTGISLSMVLGIPTTATLRPRLLISCVDNQDQEVLLIVAIMMKLISQITNEQCHKTFIKSLVFSLLNIYTSKILYAPL